MRSLFTALLLVLAACVSVPAAAQLEGSYHLTHINGTALPTASPTEGTITIGTMTLLLKADGQYEMEFTGHHASNGTPIAIDINGAYRVEGGELALYPDEGMHADPADFTWTLQDGTLTLVDDGNDRFTFARQ